MENPNLNDDYRGVKSDEIRWSLGDPVPPTETVDLLTLTDDELLEYARGLQQETAWLRTLLHEALTHLHQLTIQLRRLVRERRRGVSPA